MPLVLVRIDDRLIHGQVVVGWRQVLKPQRIVLCSDEVASTDWQRTIYESAVPPELGSSVLTMKETIKALKDGAYDHERVILLVDTPKSIVELVNASVAIKEVNVGGMHFRPGKNQVAPFIFVDEDDINSFRILFEKGIRLEGRDVPTRPRLDIAKALSLGED